MHASIICHKDLVGGFFLFYFFLLFFFNMGRSGLKQELPPQSTNPIEKAKPRLWAGFLRKF